MDSPVEPGGEPPKLAYSGSIPLGSTTWENTMTLSSERKREYQRKRNAERRAIAIEAFGGKCSACESDEALEFDHIDRASKAIRIATIWSRTWDTIWNELEKCQLLCYTCHKKKTTSEFTKLTHGTRNTYMRHGCRCRPCVEEASRYREAQRNK